MRSMLPIALFLLPAALLSGCAVGPTTRAMPAVYDLGPQRDEPVGVKSVNASVLLHGVVAPAWLDTTAIVYRLNYQNPARQQAYANARWATAPAALLTQRLRAKLAAASASGVVSASDGARADYALRVELDDFSQVFDAEERSRVVVVASASLISTASRKLVAQRSFTVEQPTASADAEGGVSALAAAGGKLADAIVAWTASGIAQDKK